MTASAMGVVITSGWIGLAVSSQLIGGIAGNDTNRIGEGLLVLPCFSAMLVVLACVIHLRLKRREMRSVAGALGGAVDNPLSAGSPV
jgi:hypothetical protein